MLNIAENSTFINPVRRPVAGENVDADTNLDPNQGPIDQGLEGLTARTDYLRRAAEDVFYSPLYKRTEIQAREASNVISIVGFTAAVNTANNAADTQPTWGEYPSTDLTPTVAIGAADWAADTWYYLYAYAVAPFTIRVEASTVAPDVRKLFKSGDLTRRYIGCFRATAAKFPRAMYKIGQEYTWRDQQDALITTVGTGAYATLNLSAYLPPHVGDVVGKISVDAENNDPGNDYTLLLRRLGDTAVQRRLLIVRNLSANRDLEMLTGTGRNIEWSLDTNCEINRLAVTGWRE